MIFKTLKKLKGKHENIKTTKYFKFFFECNMPLLGRTVLVCHYNI